MKFVVGYSVPHTHEVKVGIEAESAEQALAKAQMMFDNGSLWDGADDCILLHDDFEEDESAGYALEFSISETLGDSDYPRAHCSVRQMEKDATARAVVEQLVEAYRRATESGEPVNSNDIDAAYLLALEAQL